MRTRTFHRAQVTGDRDSHCGPAFVIIGEAGSVVLNIVIVAVAFKVLTSAELSWGDVLPGAAVGFMLAGLNLFAMAAGGLIAGLSSGYVALKTTFAGTDAEKAATVSVWGFRAPLGGSLPNSWTSSATKEHSLQKKRS